MRRARRQLKGPLAIAGAILLAGCSSAPEAVPASPAFPATTPVAGRVTEATSVTAPLGVRVVSVRRETADSIRLELSLANLAAADTWTPESAVATAVQTAVQALDDASVLSADGRRRMFALRGGSGKRVGSPATAPAPGHPETFWTLFPAAEGEVSVLLPGFTPLAGLTVTPGPGQPEP
jgi:hypothetical protein